MHEVVFDKVDKMQSSTLSIRPRSFEPNRSTGIYKSAMCVRACLMGYVLNRLPVC